MYQVVKRDGKVTEFEISKISKAITKAFEALGKTYHSTVIDLISLLVKGGLVATRNEGRRSIEQGGVTVNDEVIRDIRKLFSGEELQKEGVLIRKGKKNFKKIILE